MVERSYGVVGNGLKWPKNQEITGDPRWPPSPLLRRPDPGVAGGGRAVKFHRHDRLDVLLPPVQRVYSDIGLNRLLWLKLERPANGLKRPILVLTGLGSFLGFLELKVSVWG